MCRGVIPPFSVAFAICLGPLSRRTFAAATSPVFTASWMSAAMADPHMKQSARHRELALKARFSVLTCPSTWRRRLMVRVRRECDQYFVTAGCFLLRSESDAIPRPRSESVLTSWHDSRLGRTGQGADLYRACFTTDYPDTLSSPCVQKFATSLLQKVVQSCAVVCSYVQLTRYATC